MVAAVTGPGAITPDREIVTALAKNSINAVNYGPPSMRSK
jgi:hypothetical protein